MLQKTVVPIPGVGVDERQVIPLALGLEPEVVQHRSEVLVHEAAVLQVDEQNAQIVGPVRLQGAGGGVGRITHLLRRGQNAQTGRLADILLAVESLAYRGHGNIAA